VEVINLTGAYLTHILHDHDLTAYEQVYPGLFSHYFEYWADRNRFVPTLDANQTRARVNLITDSLEGIAGKLTVFGLDVSSLQVVLFVGMNTSNGHAFKDGNTFVVWIPVETYKTPLDAEVFLTHEIIHALHYACSPGFYFNSVSEKLQVSRQLITEGMATYLSMISLNIDESVALWADYLSGEAIEDWLDQCRDRERELKKYLLDNFFSTNPNVGMFYARDPQDIFQYRGGYYIGLKFMEHAVQAGSLKASRLLCMQRDELENLAIEYLREGSS